MQLLFTFIILSIVTLIAVLLIILSKNSRSQKISNVCQDKQWQYQEFVNFSDSIKNANFGLLNYSQNAIFRHVISADDKSFGLEFNFFDCRAIEPLAIHNSSALIFNLKLNPLFSELHASFSPAEERKKHAMHSGLDKGYFQRIRNMQKLIKLKPHYAFEQHELYANNPSLLEDFLQQHLSNREKQTEEETLSAWLLAHPHLHIEISTGMLLAYQPNHLLNDEAIIPAITHVAKISQSLSQAS